MIEHTPRTERIKLPEILDASRVAEVAHEIFKSTPFEIGRQFVEPNVVLAMAGLKPSTEISIFLDEQIDLASYSTELQKLGAPLSTLDAIASKPIGPLIHAFKQRPMALSGIISLRGAERISKLSRFKGMPEYKITDGLRGYNHWMNEVWQWLQSAQKNGSIPENYELMAIYEGIHLGYPDQAIWDFTDCMANQGDRSLLLHSHNEIPEMDRHWGALPTYNFYPEHAQDPGIVENIAATSRLLKEFYASPAYQNIMTDPRWKTA